ncbi:MAG: type II toxin-antitoxin system RelE/ParE family toxin [Nitrospinae bacterium]|nr:type II toxin-antitoxin system RelE/ParE family toxin [Nitrospinota bacterium]
MNQVQFDPEARSEFLATVRYYEECQLGLGNRFRLVFESATRRISKTPFRYRLLKAPFRGCLLPKFPYLIIYSVEPDHIRIIALAHTKRKPGYWLSRTAHDK